VQTVGAPWGTLTSLHNQNDKNRKINFRFFNWETMVKVWVRTANLPEEMIVHASIPDRGEQPDPFAEEAQLQPKQDGVKNSVSECLRSAQTGHD
jgi:hypothetical protein